MPRFKNGEYNMSKVRSCYNLGPTTPYSVSVIKSPNDQWSFFDPQLNITIEPRGLKSHMSIRRRDWCGRFTTISNPLDLYHPLSMTYK